VIESTIAIPANCFTPKGYVKSNPATGLLSSRHGDRLIAVPEVLMRSIPKALREEAGEASYLALYTFGKHWGKTFCDRVLKDMINYYHEPILEMNASEFLARSQEAWAVHGLGRPAIDFSLAERGLLVVTIANSGIAESMAIDADATYRSFSLEAGFVAGWLAALTEKALRACAIDWIDAPNSIQFLVGAKPHIEAIERNHLNEMLTVDRLREL
jgi:uncharacterized protein